MYMSPLSQLSQLLSVLRAGMCTFGSSTEPGTWCTLSVATQILRAATSDLVWPWSSFTQNSENIWLALMKQMEAGKLMGRGQGQTNLGNKRSWPDYTNESYLNNGGCLLSPGCPGGPGVLCCTNPHKTTLLFVIPFNFLFSPKEAISIKYRTLQKYSTLAFIFLLWAQLA